MPPRITRSKWPCLFPRHDPLPFLYPRWITVGTADAKIDNPDQNKDQQPQQEDDDGDAASGNAGSRMGEGNIQDAKEAERRYRKPSASLIRRLAVKSDIRKSKEASRKELRNKFADADDWRTPMASLRRHTPNNPRHHVRQLERLDMPEGMRGYYRGDLHELFVQIYLHTGCHVQVSRYKHVDRTSFEALELAGTRMSVNLAKEMLNESILVTSGDDLNADKNMGSYTVTSTPIKRPDAAPRSVWAARPVRRRRLATIHKPSAGTTITRFANYIENLVNSESSRDSHTSGKPLPHVDVVTARLLDVFLDPHYHPFVTSHACAIALQYLARHRKLPELRRIFEALDGKSVHITPQVFNVCIHAAAEACDMHNYTFLLHLMLSRNVAPDHDTWANLVSLVQARSPRNTKHVISAMRARGLLASHAAKIAVANAVIKHDFAEWIARDDSTDEFIAQYDRTWGGPTWLDARCANIMLTLRVERAEFEDAIALLHTLSERGRQPNTVSLNILLMGAAKLKDISAATAALELLLPRYKSICPNLNTFEQLARVAWDQRAHNVLRVVWRYACLYGQVSYKMRTQMEKGLLSAIPSIKPDAGVGSGAGDDRPAQSSRGAIFRAVAARMAVGIDKRYRAEDFVATDEPENEAQVPTQSTQSISSDDATSTKAEPPASLPSSSSSRRGLLAPLRRDLSSITLHSPALPLDEMFAKAAERDREWALSGKRKSTDLEWFLDNAIDIEVA